ncbi:50S ribosomal protein L23 [bacterium]|nr:50S ribosomal protein L23 [bacterium]MCI0614608.1 50S ribosomal protein L23 [bacterium]
MNHTQILKRPLLTEKSNTMKADKNIVCFEVDRHANKIQIKAAVEKMFGVKVEAVTTSVVHGKKRRYGRSVGLKSDWKKAYVKVKEGEKKIEFFEGM